MHRVARRHVQYGIALPNNGGTLVQRMGIWRAPLEEQRKVSQILAALVRRQIQDADVGDSWPKRLPARRERRFSTVHDPAAIKDSVEDVVFPGRRSLGAQAAEFAAVVQDGQRLGGSVVSEMM